MGRRVTAFAGIIAVMVVIGAATLAGVSARHDSNATSATTAQHASKSGTKRGRCVTGCSRSLTWVAQPATAACPNAAKAAQRTEATTAASGDNDSRPSAVACADQRKK